MLNALPGLDGRLPEWHVQLGDHLVQQLLYVDSGASKSFILAADAECRKARVSGCKGVRIAGER